ncbi:fasciclin domain-containing protein [Sphingomonas sp. BN140010]|uniref:Fasciclin domain-containing protein n=1 Tax=Sphingomonas arvum TaxID=2992113 RepID=A0ABT3JF25_9SPHN|nr:fasciclin domain-containing protein [Sphingomonas sp. BN140010]MCW3797678.1 fasciclin domain-containing protein [Sphingomonas sp. BN140010]
MIARVTLLGAAALALGACNKGADGNAATANQAGTNAAAPSAAKGTLADLIARPDAARFAAAVRSVGMEPVLKGPGPYTLLLPTDAAMNAAGDLGTDKQKLTRLLSNHVLPGTITAADIGKAIDGHGGKAQLATMAGTTLTATRQGNAIRLSGPNGAATVTGAEEVVGNGIVHRIDAVLKPAG